MAEVIFPTQTPDITPSGSDRVLLSQTSNGGAASDATLDSLPISTATQTAIGLKVDKSTTVNGQDLSSNVTLTTDDVAQGATNLYDQVVAILASTGIQVTGTYPNFTITNSSPDQVVALTQGTGITVSGTYPNFTITNSAPDQTVTLTQGTNITITGTYPNFTINSTGGGGTGDMDKATYDPAGIAQQLVGTTATQTLTNKTLDDTTTRIADTSDPTKQIKFDIIGTTGVTGTIRTVFTTANTITLPDATDTLVGRSTSDILSNKTIGGNSLYYNNSQSLTSGGATTVLTSTSYAQNLNGGTGANIAQLPVASTMQVGQEFVFDNTQTGNTNALTINSSGGNLVYSLPAGENIRVVLIKNTGTDASSWRVEQQFVPTYRTITINGVTYDLSADRSWTVSGLSWGASISAGSGVGLTMSSSDLSGANAFQSLTHTASGTLTACTTTQKSLSINRTYTLTSGSVTDNFIGASFSRSHTTTGAGGTLLEQGSVVSISGTDTQTAGTLTPSYDLLALNPSLRSTGSAINITVPNSIATAPTNAYFYILRGNTQTVNSATMMKIDIGTSSVINSTGIVLTGGASNGASGYATLLAITNTDGGAATTYANTGIAIVNNSRTVKNIGIAGNIASGTGITIRQAFSGTAFVITGDNNVNSSTNGLSVFAISNTQSGATVMQKIDTGTSAQGHTGLLLNIANASTSISGISATLSSTGTGVVLRATSSALGGGEQFLNLGHTASGTLTACTVDKASIASSRTYTLTSGSVTDNYNVGSLSRTSVTTGAGGTLLAQGAVLKISNTATQTAGTLTDSVTPLLIVQGASSTGSPIAITQNAVVSTNYRRLIKETNTGITIWMGNGTTANGTLSGTAGDILINGGSNKPEYCTGTTTWVALV